MPTATEDRPSYVQFERRPVEDREATIRAGCYQAKDVDFVVVTPQGNKDTIVRPVTEWLAHLNQQVSEGRFPGQWFDGYTKGYERWKAGVEGTHIDGTPVDRWPGASPAEVKSLQSLRLFAVEDVANMGEDAIHRIGPGGLALRQKAKAFLSASADSGRMAQENSALRAANEDLQIRNKGLQESNEALQTEVNRLTALTGAKPK